MNFSRDTETNDHLSMLQIDHTSALIVAAHRYHLQLYHRLFVIAADHRCHGAGIKRADIANKYQIGSCSFSVHRIIVACCAPQGAPSKAQSTGEVSSLQLVATSVEQITFAVVHPQSRSAHSCLVMCVRAGCCDVCILYLTLEFSAFFRNCS